MTSLCQIQPPTSSALVQKRILSVFAQSYSEVSGIGYGSNQACLAVETVGVECWKIESRLFHKEVFH